MDKREVEARRVVNEEEFLADMRAITKGMGTMVSEEEKYGEKYVGTFCKCPECGSKDVWGAGDASYIRCKICGFREKKEIEEE